MRASCSTQGTLLRSLWSPKWKKSQGGGDIRLSTQEALVVKNPPASAGDARDAGAIPGSGRSPGEYVAPTPVLSSGESHGQRSLTGYSP